MGDEDQVTSQGRGGWRRRAIVAALLFCALLVIFHRPLLLDIGRFVIRHYAAKQNLRADFRLEGSVFSYLILRNLHVAATGPTNIESIDADRVRVDYNLMGLLRHGMSDFLQNAEVHSARIVLNPANAPQHLPKKAPGKKTKLPGIFPENLRLSNATFIVRASPHDFEIEHLDLDLNPRVPGELRIGQLQFPTGQSWSKISAQTSYAHRNLVLRDLALTDSDRIRLLNVDASHIDENRLLVTLNAAVGGGTVSASVALQQAGPSLNSKIHLIGQQIGIEDLSKYAALPDGFLGGNIEKLTIDGTGVLNAPRTWNVTIAASINNFHERQVAFDRCVLLASATEGTATLQSAEIVQGRNDISLHGSGELPAKLDQLSRSQATLAISAKVPDLGRMTMFSKNKISGSGEANGKVELVNDKLTATFDLDAGPLLFADGSIEKLNASVRAAKRMPSNEAGTAGATAPKKPWFASLTSNINLNVSNVQCRDYAIDSINGTLASVDDSLKVEKLDVRRKQNDLALHGRYQLPENFKRLARTGDLNFLLNAPEVGDFWISDSPDQWNGPLQGSGRIEWKNGAANGEWSVFASNLQMRDLVVEQFNSQGVITNDVAYVNDFSARLNAQDFVSANGTVDLYSPYRYSGTLSANLSDLSKLQPLLHASGNQNELAGSLMVDWKGRGVGAKFKNSGELKLTLENGRYGNLQSLHANVNATYSPDQLDIPTVFVSSDQMDFQAIVEAKGQNLEITKIQLDQGQAKYASGYIAIPLIWKNIGTNAPLFASNGQVIANFQSEDLDIKKLFEDIGAKPIAAGTLNVKFDARGAFEDMNAHLDIEMRDLRNEKLPKLEPGHFALNAQLEHNQLAILGKFEQAKIQPIQLTAKLPFDPGKIAQQRGLPDNTPITAKVELPRSSVNFIGQFVPAVRQVDGSVALDADVNGTIGHPVFTGAADMNINYARANDPTLPALQNFKANLKFENNALILEQFGGELSAGRFTVTGRVTFPKLTTANLDLHLNAESALIARNDTLTMRTDADVKVDGPINKASVTGTVVLTNSRLLKNIDLIPIGLPGRPAPQPPASHPNLIFPPPFTGWKFDVAIKTKDPVLLRGNLATGKAVVDLHLTGRGSRPGLDGWVRLENAEATLPFSRLEVSQGFLYFDPNDPLDPKIDLHGTSLVQNYTVRVYVYGTMLSPEAVFTSEPPLPQEDIISLLATGTTRQELTGSNSALAGRAAMLLVQQLYHKIFKKGQPAQSSSVFDRLSVDFGQVDPRTGQQKATARFKVNDQFVLVGDVGVGGDYRGMVKYLIHFY